MGDKAAKTDLRVGRQAGKQAGRQAGRQASKQEGMRADSHAVIQARNAGMQASDKQGERRTGGDMKTESREAGRHRRKSERKSRPLTKWVEHSDRRVS